MTSALSAIVAEVLPPVPAPRGHFDDAVLPLAQIVPIGFEIDRFRIAAAQTNHGNRIRFRHPAGGSTPLASVPSDRDPHGVAGRSAIRPHLNGFWPAATIVRALEQCRQPSRMRPDEVFG